MNTYASRRRLALIVAVIFATSQASPGPAAEIPLRIDPRRDATVITVEQVLPSVVNIATTELRQVNDPIRAMIMQFNGQRPVERGLSVGSGVIMDEEGYVLTADHVVRHATEIWVKLADGRERQADRVLNDNARTDVTLLKIRTRPGDTFKPIQLAEDDDLLLGETVIALGNPLGLGTSVSRGILSSKNRRPPPELEPLGPGDWLQTDAAINQGNSGGPLVNLRGELIGLNVAVQPGGEGIAFAIPIRIVTDALSEVLTPERINGLWFGAQIKPGRGAGPNGGGTVVEVQPESPASKAGLRPGDLVLAVNEQSTHGFIDLTKLLLAQTAKGELALTVERAGAKRDFKVRLVEEKTFFNAALIKARTGATVMEMTPAIARSVGLRQPEGLVVTQVEPGSPAAGAKVQRNAVFTTYDERAVGSLVDFAKMLFGKKPGDTVTLDYFVFLNQGGFLVPEKHSAQLKLR